jgi:hypothetical protein
MTTPSPNLKVLLSKLVQRLIAYQFILGKLVEATPENYKDYQHLKNTYSESTAPVSNIYNKQEQYEALHKADTKDDIQDPTLFSRLSRALGTRTHK